MTSYAIQWDGKTVTLPPAGPINPDGVSWARIRDEDGDGIYDLRLIEFADATFAARGKRVGSISVDLVLIPRPDNPFDSDAVSIALPRSVGGDEEERCLGYLYRHTTSNWGIANNDRKDLVSRLAAFSEDGEVHFTAIMSRESDPADIAKYRCSDDEEGWDIPMRIPELTLDLPKARIMGAAIRDFLAAHEDSSDSESSAPGPRLTEEQFTRTPALRWLHGLRTELVKHLADEVVHHADSNHPVLQVRRRVNFAVRVVNETGGCVGLVRTNPDLVEVGSEFDRPAVVAALAQAGIKVPFDPTPGWLNASLELESGAWIHVFWVGRISGINVEPYLASFDLETKELHVFAPDLASPIEKLLRRAGQIPESVLLRDHPRDPHQLFGQDLIARLQNPRPVRKLRPDARQLIPADWADQIEAGWQATEDLRARNGRGGMSFGIPPQHRRPPEAPRLPVDLLRDIRIADDQPTNAAGGCRLCGGALNPYAEPSPYCLDCIRDALDGLFVDHGFHDEPWHDAAIGSIIKLAAHEFGDAPAHEQLRTMPSEGPHRDLLMLCRMLAVRRGYAIPGGHRKVYSWTDWLAKAGVLATGVRTSRGVVVTAKDGHLCRSLLERQIDDFFFDHGIEHELEPFYPFDPDINPDGFRADWRLADGTFVEALGFTANPAYMAKAERKIDLASRHQIPVVTVTESDLRNLPNIFAKWLPPESDRPQRGELAPRPPRNNTIVTTTGSASNGSGKSSGQNASNSQARADRLDRCRRAVELQAGGATRRQIAEHLGVSNDVVPALLRDGKFYANPDSDQVRLSLAQKAAEARERGLTRSGFRDQARLSNAKADECWRDADVLFGESLSPPLSGADGVANGSAESCRSEEIR
ncbi:MAG: hypothetical protein K1X67_15515 [Fimbriimonadaceae bacterium]|nr:hypothetical protein [Fimbriimonadaceae bacterium]